MGKHPCLRCKHFIEQAEIKGTDFGKCKAFPNGIPYEVYAFMDRFKLPEHCNNGIGFEPEIENIETAQK